MSHNTFLVTGAGGYVGGQLVRHLVSEGIRVRAMVRDPSKASFLKDLPVEVVTADMTDRESLRAAVQGVTGVYHIAAIYRQASFAEEVFHAVNAEGTRTLLELSVQAGVKRFVHCSTGGVLGHIANPPGNHLTPYNPGDMYQRSKVEAEKAVLEYFSSGRIRGAVIRPAMIYGPADTRHLKMFKMISRRRFFFVGRGEAWVHFIDIRDLVRAFRLAMEHEEINGGVYSIAGRRVMRLHEACKIIAEKMGVSPPWLRLPVKPMQWLGSACEALCRPFGIEPPIFRRRVDFFTKSRFFDISKAKTDLGYEPAQEFEGEVADTVRWYKDHSWI